MAHIIVPLGPVMNQRIYVVRHNLNHIHSLKNLLGALSTHGLLQLITLAELNEGIYYEGHNSAVFSLYHKYKNILYIPHPSPFNKGEVCFNTFEEAVNWQAHFSLTYA